MQAFEFHFNPKAKHDLIFDSFCYEPENIYEKRLGNLYMTGFLKNTLPQNFRLLDNLARTIKEKYYNSRSLPEKALKESLKAANEFLENISKEGNVSWLGNFNFAVLSIRELEFNFTKVGDLKTLLLRNGQLVDIDKNIKLEGIEPYPLKVFGNIVSGKLAQDDMVLVLNKEVFNVFNQENVLTDIAKITPFNQKQLRSVLASKQEKLLKTSGLCLMLVLSQEALAKEKEIILPRKIQKVFSFKESLSPLALTLNKLIPRIKTKKKLSLPSLPSIPFKLNFNLKIPKVPLAKVKIKGFSSNKNIILILALIIFLFFGFLLFRQLEEKAIGSYKIQLSQIQDKTNEAKGLLLLASDNPKAKEQANGLLLKTLEELSPLVDLAGSFPADFSNQVLSLEEDISSSLYQINNLEKLEEPELLFGFKADQFIPQKLAVLPEEIYLFSPYSQNIFRINQENQGELIGTEAKPSLSVEFNETLLFLVKPDTLFKMENKEFKEAGQLQPPYLDYDFGSFAQYNSSLYLLDKKKAEVIKYPYQKELQWGSPQTWLAEENRKAKDFQSLAVDGSVWLLTRNNTIERYYAGSLQNTFKLDIFPMIKSPSKIYTSLNLPYLYLLEPSQNRILILNKSGAMVKQFQSDKFDNLLDFGLSEDGKTIYLLNGLNLYKVLF